MKFTKAPIAFAVFALCASAPFAAHAISVSFKAPAAGATLTNVTYYQGTQCEVSGSDIRRVVFSLVSSSGTTTALNTETSAPWQCNLTSKNFADGNYTLRAVAYDSSNRTATATRSVTIKNNVTTDAKPTVSFSAPANNATISAVTTCQVSASDDKGVKQVQFFVDGTLLSTDTTSAYQCSIDNKKYTNGAHTLKAVVTDSANQTAETQITINISGGIGTANTPPVVAFKSPASGTQIASGGALTSCEVTATDSNGIQQVQFFMNGALYHTELLAPYTCGFTGGKFPNGAYELKAVATDKLGAKSEAKTSLTIGTTTTNTPPTVGITSPASGATLTGTAATYTATASDTGGSVAKVDMYLASGTTQKLIDTKTASPYSGTINTTGLPNGAATLMAVATDNQGATSSVQRSVTIDNTVVSSPAPTEPAPQPTGTTLPSTNAKAVATFESLGMYWKPGSNPGAAGCSVRYRKSTESAWKEGFPMWYDSRDGECRGSLVHLAPGTDYAVEMGVGSTFAAGVNTRTWSETFPIGQTIQVQNSSQTLKITQGGTKDAYVLYTGPATIDVANAQTYNIEISAPYVIVRGLTLKGAQNDAIRLLPGAKDVVIEDNDISGWGRLSEPLTAVTGGKWQVGIDRESAIRADCASSTPWLERVVIQRNKMHHPRYTSISWDWQHPGGPQAVTFNQCGGNHVMRYNEVYSSDGGNYFNDGFSGGANFSAIGFPNSDTDIYGNRISHTWDDGIEAEGGNKNVRIWGNYIDQTAIGIATTVVHYGPLYMFRNVYNRSRKLANVSLDLDGRLNFAKSGTQPDFGGGRRYVFHNTMLQATQSGLTYPLGAGGGLIAAGSTSPLTNTMSRNNILHVWKSSWDSIRTQGGSGNDLDYDLRNGGISAYAGAEANGIVGTPIYKAGHGWESWGNGNYQLETSSPGYDRGARLPNFNDGFTGNGPDVGAHEAGTPAMRLGVSGSSTQWAAPSTTTTTATTTTTSTSTSTTGSTTTTTTDAGTVCSSALCVVTQ